MTRFDGVCACVSLSWASSLSSSSFEDLWLSTSTTDSIGSGENLDSTTIADNLLGGLKGNIAAAANVPRT